MKRKIVFLSVILSVAVGCQKEDSSDNSKNGTMTLSATIQDSQTKATIDYGNEYVSGTGETVKWQAGDKVRVIDAGENQEYTLTSGAGTKFAEFTGAALTFAPGAAINVYYPSTVTVTGGMLNLSEYDVLQQDGTTMDVVANKMVMRATVTSTIANQLPSMIFTYKTGLLHFKIDQVFLGNKKPKTILLRCTEAVFAIAFDDSQAEGSKYTYGTSIVLNITNAVYSDGVFHAYIPVLPTKDLTDKSIEIVIYNEDSNIRTVTLDATTLNTKYSNKFDAGKVYYFSMKNSGTLTFSPTVPINGVKWAKGSLVADGPNGCKVGAPTDGGLYFRWGALIGWSGGATTPGDGTGITASTTLAAVVKPSSYTPTPNWSTANPYDNNTYGPSYPITDKPITDSPSTGIGDPCSFYLGVGWRMSTSSEMRKLFNNLANSTALTSIPNWSWHASPAGISYSYNGSNLFFPASGYRWGSVGAHYAVGGTGNYWNGSPNSAANGFNLYFSSNNANPADDYYRAYGFPLRCVQE